MRKNIEKKYNIKIFLACLNVVLVLVLVLATWTKLCSKRKLPLQGNFKNAHSSVLTQIGLLHKFIVRN